MKEYQLCRSQKAAHPFYIETIDVNIETIEELCFYFEQNLSLLDETVINEKLCLWLGEALGMERLRCKVQEKLEAGIEAGAIALAILKDTAYLQPAEWCKVQAEWQRLAAQPKNIRRKAKGDRLMHYGMYSRAADEYRLIMEERNEGTTGLQFYASVMNGMAAAYARMFLFREAADCLWQSYSMVRSNAVYRKYLAILPYFMSKEAYQAKLAELKIPKEQLRSIEAEKQQAAAKAQMQILSADNGYQEWQIFLEKEKRNYHRSRL